MAIYIIGNKSMQISDEELQDKVNTLLTAGTNITLTYDDDANSLTIAATDTNTQLSDEEVQDKVNALLTAGSNVTLTYDDDAGTLTIAATDTNTQLSDEEVQDKVNALLTAGSNIALTYDDDAGTLTIAATDTNTQLTDEEVQDKVNALLTAGSNVTLTYDDANNTLTIAASDTQLTDEEVQDKVNALLTAGSNVTLTYDDANNTLTIAASDTQLTDEEVQDKVNALLTAGSNINLTYDDDAGTLTIASTATGGSGTTFTEGTTYPASHEADERFKLTANATLKRFVTKSNNKLTAETSATNTDFDANEIRILSTNEVNFDYQNSGSAFATAIAGLGSGDEIHLVPDSGTTVVIALSGSPTPSQTLNFLINVMTISSTNVSSVTGSLVDGTAYRVYGVKSGTELKGSIFKSDGALWERVFQNTLVIGNVPDALITGAKLASDAKFAVSAITNALTAPADADHFVVSDESETGDPNKKITYANLKNDLASANAFKVSAITNALTALAGADHFVVSDESETGDPNRKITWTNLVAAIVDALEALTGTAQLDNMALKNRNSYTHGNSLPSNPVNGDIHRVLSSLTAHTIEAGPFAHYGVGTGFQVESNGSVTFPRTISDWSPLANAVSGDKIGIANITDGTQQTITLSAAGTNTTISNINAYIRWTSSQFSVDGGATLTLTSGKTYRVYLLKSYWSIKDAILQSNGYFWKRLSDAIAAPEAVPFGGNWIDLWSSASGFNTENSNTDLLSNERFDNYTYLMFVAKRPINQHKWQYETCITSDFVSYGISIQNDAANINVEYVDHDTFKLSEVYNSMKLYKVRGHK